jgi:hypothetical protein
MPANYVANGPISGPLYVPGATPDVDLNAFKFSYQIGMFYTVEAEPTPMQPPT